MGGAALGRGAGQVTETRNSGGQESWDGRHCYFHGRGLNGFGIWRVPVEGGECVRVAEGESGGWSLSREGIRFVRKNALESNSFDTERIEKVMDLLESARGQITISLGGSRLLYVKEAYTESNIMLVENSR